MFDNFFSLIAISLLIEGLISYAKTIHDKHKIQWQVVLACILGGIFCYNAELDFFTILGLEEKFPIIGTIATAIILSRGSNYLFEAYEQLASWRQHAKQPENLGNMLYSEGEEIEQLDVE